MTEEPIKSTSEVEVHLNRDLGLAEVLMIGIGPNIGSSIFLMIGIAAGISGPALLLTFILNFFVTLITAMAYAELSSAFPETGGGYRWIKEGLFAPLGFLGGWMSWVGHCIACSVYALGFGLGVRLILTQYNVDFFGLSNDLIVKLFTVFIVILFCWLNFRGVKGAGRSEILVSGFLIGIIVAFIVFGLAAVFGHSPSVVGFAGLGPEFVPFGTLSIFVAMGFTFMIFEGYEVVAQTGEEAKNPTKTVPRAMFLCITIAAVLFITVALVTFLVIGWQGAAGTNTDEASYALNRAADQVIPVLGGALMSIGMIIGSVAAVNSIIFSASRVSFAMGRDGNLPAVFSRLHPTNHTPTFAIIISTIIIIVMAIALPIDNVASVADVMILLLFVLVNLSLITLRYRRPESTRTFYMPGFPYLSIVGVISNLFLAILLFERDALDWYIALTIIFAGLLIHYFVTGRREIETLEAPERLPMTEEARAQYRVLIPIDDPKSEGLIDLGVIMANEHHGEILLTTVVEVPSTVPLTAVEKKRVEERKRMLEHLKGYSELRGIKTRAIVLVSHDIVTSIIDTARDESANMIILGWKGYTHTQKRILGTKMDDLIRRTPCDIIVLKSEGHLKPDRILILSGGLWQVSRATEVAADIAKADSSRITILNVIVNERYLVRAADYSKRLKGIVESKGVPVIVKDTRPETIVGGVVAETLDYDLLVIGSSPSKRWDQFAFGPIQDIIAKSSRCPVLVYKRVSESGEPAEKDDADEQ